MRKWLRRILAVGLIWFAGVALWIGAGPAEPVDSKADVAIILGAAAYGNLPSPVFRERIAHGITLYRQGRVRFLLFTGGTRDPAHPTEAAVGRAMAIRQGVPAAAILMEDQSRTTRQNLAYAKIVMLKAKLRSAIIVSDPLHMRRAMAMADDLGLSATPSGTPTTRYRGIRAKAEFLMRESWFMHQYWLVGA